MAFEPLDIALLPALAAFCFVTSREDMREGLIRNRWIAAALAWSGAVYLAFTLSLFFTPALTFQVVSNDLFQGSWWRLLGLTALNSACALALAFVLFHFELWSAGDAKMFFALSCLLPLKHYFNHYLPVFPSFNLFLNTIMVSAVFVWSEALWKLSVFLWARREEHLFKEAVGASLSQLRGGVKLLAVSFLVFGLAALASRWLGLRPRDAALLTVLVVLALLFSSRALQGVLQKTWALPALYAAAAVFAAAVSFTPYRWEIIRLAGIMSVTFLVVFFVAGVLPALSTKYGVQREDMPFALWLSAGAVLTVVIKGSLLYLVYR